MSDQNLPATIDKAMQIVKEQKTKGSLIYVRDEDLQAQAMFVPEITVLETTPEDFHTIDGRYQPKSHKTDQIGTAAGVSFIPEHCGTRIVDENIVVGFAQGKRRLPDGTFRTSNVQEYEFDCGVRAELDFLADTKGKYSSDIAKKKHILELRKFRTARASTGARLKVIRELVGIPISFTAPQMRLPLVIGRISLNTDKLLEDPGTRGQVIQNMLGSADNVYGPAKVLPVPGKDENTIHGTAEEVPETDADGSDQPPDDDDFNLFPDAPLPDGDPAEAEYKELRLYIETAMKQFGQKNHAEALAWLKTKESENLDNLREKKAQIETAIVKHMAAKKGGVKS